MNSVEIADDLLKRYHQLEGTEQPERYGCDECQQVSKLERKPVEEEKGGPEVSESLHDEVPYEEIEELV